MTRAEAEKLIDDYSAALWAFNSSARNQSGALREACVSAMLRSEADCQNLLEQALDGIATFCDDANPTDNHEGWSGSGAAFRALVDLHAGLTFEMHNPAFRALPAPPTEPATPKTLRDFGYAPGKYSGQCMHCKVMVFGVDKRCRCCKPCAEALMAASKEPAKPAKGEYGGECNRTVCKRSPANWANHGTNRFYCEPCAKLINANNRDIEPPLCSPANPTALQFRGFSAEERSECAHVIADVLQDADEIERQAGRVE